MEFAEKLYELDDKNKPETPMLRLKYPVGYPNKSFPINGRVIEIKGVNDSANGKALLLHMAKCVVACAILLW